MINVAKSSSITPNKFAYKAISGLLPKVNLFQKLEERKSSVLPTAFEGGLCCWFFFSFFFKLENCSVLQTKTQSISVYEWGYVKVPED